MWLVACMQGSSDRESSAHMSACMCAKSLQSCPTLCNPRDCSPPGSSVHGILQARKLEWVTMPSSKGSSQPRDRTSISYVCCSFKGHFFKGGFSPSSPTQQAGPLLFICLFLAVLGLCCWTQAFSSCHEWGLFFFAVCRLLFAKASLVVEHRL